VAPFPQQRRSIWKRRPRTEHAGIRSMGGHRCKLPRRYPPCWTGVRGAAKFPGGGGARWIARRTAGFAPSGRNRLGTPGKSTWHRPGDNLMAPYSSALPCLEYRGIQFVKPCPTLEQRGHDQGDHTGSPLQNPRIDADIRDVRRGARRCALLEVAPLRNDRPGAKSLISIHP
jgi:hypothetical protein